nr:MAG TPA: hypothetical protein [Bacteriophage sp.]
MLDDIKLYGVASTHRIGYHLAKIEHPILLPFPGVICYKRSIIKLICVKTGIAFRTADRSSVPLDEIAGIISLYHAIGGGR